MKNSNQMPTVAKVPKSQSIHDTEFMCCLFPNVQANYTHFIWYEWIKVIVITRGSLKSQVGEQSFDLQTGDALFLGYNCIHYLSNIEPDTQRTEIYLNIGLVLDKLNSSIVSGACAPMRHSSLLNEMLERLTATIQYTDESGKFAFYATLYQLISEMLSLLAHQKKAVQVNQTLENILTYLNLTYTKHTTMTMVSQEFGYSKQYITRLFQKHLGISFYQYLNRLRMAKAKVLLVSSEMKIIDISEVCGFENERKFLYTFKKETGLSPSIYRKQKQIEMTSFKND